jgi:hypothetical protein
MVMYQKEELKESWIWIVKQEGDCAGAVEGVHILGKTTKGSGEELMSVKKES